MIRNVALVWGGLIGLGLAAWRSMIAEKQARIAQSNMLDARYQEAVKLLTDEKIYIRIGAIHAIRNLAFQNPDEFCQQTISLLTALRDSRRIVQEKNKTEDSEGKTDRVLLVVELAIFDLQIPSMVSSKGDSFYDRAMERSRRQRQWRAQRAKGSQDTK